MSIQDPGTRPTEWGVAGDHERRLRALEAACCVDSGAELTYPEIVLAEPCLAHYWPGDEQSGDAIDRVGALDLAVTLHNTGSGTYPQYGAAGPFTALPALTAVVNAGAVGVLAANDNRFYNVSLPSFLNGTNPFTVEGWWYVTADTGIETFYRFGASTGIVLELFAGALLARRGLDSVLDPTPLTLNTWHYIVVRYDGTDLELLNDTVSCGTDASGVVNCSGSSAWMNLPVGPSWSPLTGRSCQLAVYNCWLDDDTLADHYSRRDTGTSAQDGYVLTADGAGGFSWEPPTVEVWIP